MTRQVLMLLAIMFIAAPGVYAAKDKSKQREDLIRFVRAIGLGKELEKTVSVTNDDKGIITITDPGTYMMDYQVLGPEAAVKAKVIVDDGVKVDATCKKAVVVTHGWIDKGAKDWPADVAESLAKRTDAGEWMCCVFDWQKGAQVLNPADAARYSRDIGGARLIKSLLKVQPELEHVHLIGHSAGTWAVYSAGKIAADAGLAVHITFLDAYVPPSWDEKALGKLGKTGNGKCYIEHYYTKDITLGMTHQDLTNAHNVDITDVDPWFKEHEFPYRWYAATITGKYGLRKIEKRVKLYKNANGLEYGFARSLEAGENRWQKSLKLKRANKAVIIRKK